MAARQVAVGFVGLGSMGGPMAANMAAKFGAGRLAAHRAVLYDVRPEASEGLARRFADKASSASRLPDVARSCRLVVLCLPDGEVMQAAVSEMAPALQPGSLVVDTSTTGPEAARAAAAVLATRSAHFLDAPVTGAPARAAAGTLTVMAGGDRAKLEEAKPVLSTFASRVLHMGAVGNGQIAKAMNNCLYNVACASLAEMLPLARRAGLPLEAFNEVVCSGTGHSFAFQQWAPHILRREFEAPKYGFPMGSAFKDLETLARVAQESGAETPPVLAAARRTYERALKMGLGGEHKGAMVKVWERELGVTCGGPEPGAE